jgi:hypothetical protein
MRELSSQRHELQIYPSRFSWCVCEAIRLVAIAGGIALMAKVLGVLP